VDDEGGFSHAASPSHHTPPSRDAPPSPEPNPPPSFSLHTNSEPLPNPPASTSMNPPSSPSKKDASSEPKGHVAKGNLQSMPKMVMPLGKDKTSPRPMKKWMTRLARKPDTRSSRQKAAKSTSNKITIRNPMREDYNNVPTNKYVLGRPLLQWCELRGVSRAMKRLHDWYMGASSVEINAFSVAVPPLAFMGGNRKIIVDFEDIWLMFCLGKLNIQLMGVWCL